MTYGSSGAGAPTSHLGMELLKISAGINILHVPYKSEAPAVPDILGGQVHIGMPLINVSVQHVRSGRLRAIGVSTLARSPILPDVPPLAEVARLRSEQLDAGARPPRPARCHRRKNSR